MDKQVLAVVNGREITRDELNQFMMSLGQNAARYANPEGEKILINELVNQSLFLSEALELNMDAEEEFQAQLAEEKLMLMKQYAVRKCLATAHVSDDELKAHYEANKEQFTKPERVKASHILVDTKETADDILEEINGGLSFGEAATKYSKCPSSERGGDLGFFGRGQMVPEFEMASFEMGLGEISQPVQTQFGYHIIQLTEKEDGGVFDLEEVSFDIMKDLTMKKQSEIYTSKVETLKEKYAVEIK